MSVPARPATPVAAVTHPDPYAYHDAPVRFDPLRREREAFTFGVGPHACPGEMLASLIAEAGVAQLLAAGVRPERLVERVTYRPSANLRIPLFTT